MWLKEVVIDGFKSYANRVVISGWDPSFTAITGLNGTGKSNILDAICFVLGITNLSQVRVKNLQELVYKQGQSRVTKASVTLVFDNRDKGSNCPVGFEDCPEISVQRQVVIGGRTKYLINGHTAQLSRVQTLFQSCSLNVNNPHFLIMQGRITKVVNMKPPEMLGMLEEASGTRMYETKKKAAQKTIQKKQSKVDEINKILTEEITPTLEKLRKERTAYMQWSANNTEIERLDRFCISASFANAEKTVQRSKEDVKLIEGERQGMLERVEEMNATLKEKNNQIKQLSAQKEKEMQSELQALEKDVERKSKELVQSTSDWTHKKEALEAEEKAQKSLISEMKEAKKSVKEKEKEKEKLAEIVKNLKEKHKNFSDAVSGLEGQLLGVGTSSNEKEKGTLASQLMEAQRLCAQAEAEEKQAHLKLKHLQATLKEREKDLKNTDKDQNQSKVSIDKKQAELKTVEEKLKEMKFDENARGQCEEQLHTLQKKFTDYSYLCEQARAKLTHLDFQYSPPTRDFDKKSVKGMVARLVKVKDAKAATALEVAAGGRLWQVVVDTEKTSKLLLQNGKLARRVTIIPLNKITSKSLSPEVVDKAERLVGKGNARIALSLVGYDKEVEEAIKYVFGGTFICADAKSAEKVTYNNEIRTRSVTLLGDSYEPSGTLTGGSMPKNQTSILLELQKLNEYEQVCEELKHKISDLKKQREAIIKAEDGAQQLREQKDLLSHAVSLLQQGLSQSLGAKLKQQVDELQKEVAETQKLAQKSAEERKKMSERAEQLERSIKDFEKEKKSKLKEIEKQIGDEKKRATAAGKELKEAQQKLDTVDLEQKQINEELQTQQQQLEKLEKTIAELQKDAKELEKVVAKHHASVAEATTKLDKEKERLTACDEKIKKLKSERDQLAKKLADTELEVKRIDHKIQRMQAEATEAKKKVEALLSAHEWIEGEKHLFGKPHTDYDYKKNPPKQAQTRLNQLRNQQEQLSKKINKKVMGMFEKAEQEYQDLMKKRQIIEKDKQKIEEVIEELDKKKHEALEGTWRKVNKDFGSIFSTLLPGTKARLTPAEGKSVLEGLEMKVAFGDVWKESLTELSGGQRSLLALSLILALLLFKPAPMYILDEIDAALDLSHTQNIGQMLKTHFPQSQFIVVSLKEGMFNNANVIFRTQFTEGVSNVHRTDNRRKERR